MHLQGRINREITAENRARLQWIVMENGCKQVVGFWKHRPDSCSADGEKWGMSEIQMWSWIYTLPSRRLCNRTLLFMKRTVERVQNVEVTQSCRPCYWVLSCCWFLVRKTQHKYNRDTKSVSFKLTESNMKNEDISLVIYHLSTGGAKIITEYVSKLLVMIHRSALLWFAPFNAN